MHVCMCVQEMNLLNSIKLSKIIIVKLFLMGELKISKQVILKNKVFTAAHISVEDD